MLELKKISENNPKGLQAVLSFSDIKRFDAAYTNIKSDYDNCIASMKSSKCLTCPHFTEHVRFSYRSLFYNLQYDLL